MEETKVTPASILNDDLSPLIIGSISDKEKNRPLINICMMVKDAGPGFADVLRANIPYMDRWAILDTGSTDNTVQTIREILKDIPGELFEEPFINFRDSRNRLLDLAGDTCTYNIMLDDTYVLEGELRVFLEHVRGDVFADSFSITIDDGYTMYGSNRITRPNKKRLRYIYLVHEILEENVNAMIPLKYGKISEVRSQYMITRTEKRKMEDINTLEKMAIEENYKNPRTIYYLGDSYMCVKNWEKAYEYFGKRASMTTGYESERQDALYYVAIISTMYLKTAWNECHNMLLDCYNADPTRSESLYHIARHYLDCNQLDIAYMYLKHAYRLGIPQHVQMSFRKALYAYHIPRDMIPLCFKKGKYKLGYKCCLDVLKYKSDDIMAQNYLLLYSHILKTKLSPEKAQPPSGKKLLCFVSPGGWDRWTGETLRSKGLGGSETFSIRYAECLVERGYEVRVFCDTETVEMYNGVAYHPLTNYYDTLNTLEITACFINRYPEYIGATVLNGVNQTYLVLHDVISPDALICIHPNLKGILCISEWHRNQVVEIFPVFEPITKVISYGVDPIDITGHIKGKIVSDNKDRELCFIFPSFANRGLLPLLRMFPYIVSVYPNARLHAFCDLENSWLNKYHGNQVEEIRKLLSEQEENVINHGWVNRNTLNSYWTKADVWLYPCTFAETCCLTAYEAAISRTLVLTNDLGALSESASYDRAIVVPGDVNTDGWKIQALNRLFNTLCGLDTANYVERNYEWAKTEKSYCTVVSDFIDKYIQNV